MTEISVKTNERMLPRKAASTFLYDAMGLKVAPATLAKLAVIGGGPPFRYFGRIPYYHPDELEAWALSRLSSLKKATCHD